MGMNTTAKTMKKYAHKGLNMCIICAGPFLEQMLLIMSSRNSENFARFIRDKSEKLPDVLATKKQRGGGHLRVSLFLFWGGGVFGTFHSIFMKFSVLAGKI